jgi:hypothetical protein
VPLQLDEMCSVPTPLLGAFAELFCFEHGKWSLWQFLNHDDITFLPYSTNLSFGGKKKSLIWFCFCSSVRIWYTNFVGIHCTFRSCVTMLWHDQNKTSHLIIHSQMDVLNAQHC